MGIEWFSDLVIVIFGLVAAIALIFIAVLLYLIYRRTMSILDSIEKTSKNVADMSSYISAQLIKPIAMMAVIVEGLRQGFDAISKLFKKQEEETDE